MIGCLWTLVRKQPIIALYYESETVLQFYNLEACLPTDSLIPLIRGGRNHHLYTAGADIYKGSFFPHTIRDSTALPESAIFSEDADDCFVKFTSLISAKDLFPQLQILMNDCQLLD